MPEIRQQLLKDVGGAIYHDPILGGELVVPTSATVTIRTQDDNGLTTDVAAATCTISSTTGRLSYTVTAGNADLQKNNYRARFAWVFDGTTYNRDEFYDVVLAMVYHKLHEETIYSEMPGLRNANTGQEVEDWINHAWEIHLLKDLRNRGLKPQQIMQPENNVRALMDKAIELMSQAMMEQVEDVWDIRRERYLHRYQERLGGIMAVDVDEDGFLTDTEAAQDGGRMRAIR